MMPAYVVGHIRVRDPQKWQEYVSQAGATFSRHSGSVVFRGSKTKTLAGEHDADQVVVLRFPDQAAVDHWFGSPEYQSLILLREQAADVTLVSYESQQ